MLTAKIGDTILCDGWKKNGWSELEESDGYADSSFPGCDFRVSMGNGLFSMAVNVVITGTVKNKQGAYRCKVEFVGDGKPSEFSGGIIWIKNI